MVIYVTQYIPGMFGCVSMYYTGEELELNQCYHENNIFLLSTTLLQGSSREKLNSIELTPFFMHKIYNILINT